MRWPAAAGRRLARALPLDWAQQLQQAVRAPAAPLARASPPARPKAARKWAAPLLRAPAAGAPHASRAATWLSLRCQLKRLDWECGPGTVAAQWAAGRRLNCVLSPGGQRAKSMHSLFLHSGSSAGRALGVGRSHVSGDKCPHFQASVPTSGTGRLAPQRTAHKQRLTPAPVTTRQSHCIRAGAAPSPLPKPPGGYGRHLSTVSARLTASRACTASCGSARR